MAEHSKGRQANAEAALIGTNIRDRRMAAGKSLASFAREVGVASPTAHGWESGLYMPRPTLLRKIAVALACSVDDLLAATVATVADTAPTAEVA